MSTPPTPLESQVRFLVEIDQLKSIVRRSYLVDGSRRENSAEHSWHAATMALVLAEHAPPGTDLSRVVTMLLLHDVVEIDAGDTFVYDTEKARDQAEREAQAADRIFGLLPSGQARTLRETWEEFASGDSPEARFARSLDRLIPLLHNIHNRGKGWREHGITAPQVRGIIGPIREGSEALWQMAAGLVEGAVTEGFLPET